MPDRLDKIAGKIDWGWNVAFAIGWTSCDIIRADYAWPLSLVGGLVALLVATLFDLGKTWLTGR